MQDINLKTIKKVHFIGIGGIGVSAIARMMMLEGKIVSGSDMSPNMVTAELAKLGATIYDHHDAKHLPADADLVIYTIAISPSNPEFAKAEELGIPMLTYPEALGQISRDKYTIAVAGTHGKTTTTAMIAKVFLDGGLDPTVVVGSFLKDPIRNNSDQKSLISNGASSQSPKSSADDRPSNFIAGKGKYFIAEACEYRRSFLNLYPKILVITNLEEDHLDYYKDLADIQLAFKELAERVPADGYIVCNTADPHLAPVLAEVKAKVIDYAKINAEGLQLKFPGAHMVADAKAALAVAEVIGVSPSTALRALNEFRGTWRRFDYQGQTANGVDVYDDYAHHPDEVRATILAAREKTKGKVVVVFQPHLYSRTRDFLQQFGRSLSLADEVILLPIYAAREHDDGSINSQVLSQEINNQAGKSEAVADFALAAEKAKTMAGPEDIILVMGAGDVVEVSKLLLA
ncbi:MAG: UDP-N-acetylmuramate--L-alanine ligase [Patescibacteria group bacterium]